ncbi:hypothetical protein [Streptomyces antimycoticus]|uniref:hypothetical protein n=1 Tax=Streptomyces antimycoticus TaxID=68175 RepID=UPI00367850C5
MSLDAMEWVWEHSHARGVARLVLLAVADRVTGPECTAYAGTSMLVRRTGAARSSVRDAVDRLVESGELEIIPDAPGPRGETRYRLPRAVAYVRAVSDSSGIGRPVTGGPETGPVRGSDHRSPDPRGAESGPEGTGDRPGGGPESGPPNQREHDHQENSGADARGTTHDRPVRDEQAAAIPAAARPLVAALDGAGVSVAWRLVSAEWAAVLAAVQRWGAEALARVAVERTAGRDIRSARYLLAIWRDPANFTNETAPAAPAAEPGGGGTVVPLRRSYADNLAAGLALLEQQGRAR